MRAVLVLCLTAACAAAQTEPDYYPMADGLSWTYAAEWSDESAGEPEITFRMSAVTAKDGRPAFLLASTSDSAVFDLRQTMRREADAIVVLAEGDRQVSTPFPALCLPTKVGATWEAERIVEGVKILLRGEIEAEETIEVPAGQYACLRVRLRGTVWVGRRDREEFEVWNWLAPGVGSAKYKVRSRHGMATLRLVSTAQAPPKAVPEPDPSVPVEELRASVAGFRKRLEQGLAELGEVEQGIRKGPRGSAVLADWVDRQAAKLAGERGLKLDDALTGEMREQAGLAIQGADDTTVRLLVAAVPELRDRDVRAREGLAKTLADIDTFLAMRILALDRGAIDREGLKALVEDTRRAVQTAADVHDRWSPLACVVVGGQAEWQSTGVLAREGGNVLVVGLGRVGKAGAADGAIPPQGIRDARGTPADTRHDYGALVACVERREEHVSRAGVQAVFDLPAAGDVLLRVNASTDLPGGFVALVAAEKR